MDLNGTGYNACSTPMITSVFFQREKEFKREMFGNLPDLHIDEYKNLLDETGIDIDGKIDLINTTCNTTCSLNSSVRVQVSRSSSSLDQCRFTYSH